MAQDTRELLGDPSVILRQEVTAYCRSSGRHPLDILALMDAHLAYWQGVNPRWYWSHEQITAEIDACLARTAYTEFA